MSSLVSDLALAPMVRFFTYAVIKNMKNKNLEHRRYVIDTDMVPRVSQKVFQASLGERIIKPEHLQPKLEESKPVLNSNKGLNQSFNQQPVAQVSKNDVQSASVFEQNNVMAAPVRPSAPHLIQPIGNQPLVPNMMPPPPMSQNQPQIMNESMPITPMPPAQIQDMMPPVSAGGEEGLSQFYGKITPLLNDPSVVVIECQGEGRPVMIVRGGIKQPTKIILSGKDISQILEKISEVAHIPIMEGVFRAAVDTFSVNAVVSEIIGSRFVIRKTQGPGPMGPGRGMLPR